MFTIISTPWLNWNEVPTTTTSLIVLFIGLVFCFQIKRQHDSETTSSTLRSTSNTSSSSTTTTSASTSSSSSTSSPSPTLQTSTQLSSDNNKLTTTSNTQNKLKLMPIPPAMPIIGHIHLLRHHQHNPWDGFDLIRQEFGDVVSLKMGIHPMVLVSSYKAMEEILFDKQDGFLNRPNFVRHHIIFGGDKENSLALCNWSETHKERRKLCRKGILPNKLSLRNQLLEEIITKKVTSFIENVQTKSIHNEDETQVYHLVTKENLLFLTSDVFLEFLCNEKHPHERKDYKEFIWGCDFVFWDINQSYLIDFLPYLTKFGIGLFYLRKLEKVTDFLREYIDDKIFKPRLEKHQSNDIDHCVIKQQQQESLKKFSGCPRLSLTSDKGDYLDALISEYLSKETKMTLADYKVGFADLLAGHAAVANILIRLLGHLSLDEKVQDMICEEAKSVDISSLNHKPYLPVAEAAMLEALRIASSPIVPHVAQKDTSISEFFVPKGTMVLFNIHHLNLSEHLWNKPYEFDPTRFLTTCDNGASENITRLNVPGHFKPFSVGKRQCLGKIMVETTTIVMVSNLCRKFRIKATNEALVRKLLKPKGSIALNPETECFDIKLYPR